MLHHDVILYALWHNSVWDYFCLDDYIDEGWCEVGHHVVYTDHCSQLRLDSIRDLTSISSMSVGG